MKRGKKLLWLCTAAMLLTACGGAPAGSALVPAAEPGLGQSGAQTPEPPRESAPPTLTDETLPEAFAAFFEGRWQTVEGAAEHMALPEGTVFFADLSGDGTPELCLTYSTGGGKQTGLFVYDISGPEPMELGLAYLAVPPAGTALEFSLWGGSGTRVLYTKGELPVGAANTTRYFTESFLSIADGRLVTSELNYSENGTQAAYYSASQEGKEITRQEYETLRRERLESPEPLETIRAGEDFNFFEDEKCLAEQVSTGLKQWREDHPQNG